MSLFYNDKSTEIDCQNHFCIAWYCQMHLFSSFKLPSCGKNELRTVIGNIGNGYCVVLLYQRLNVSKFDNDL